MLGLGKALVNYGPVCLSVEAWRSNKPHDQAAKMGALRAIKALDELVVWLAIAKLPISHPACVLSRSKPEVLRQMIEAVKMLGQDDFTPMAAVAGTFSQLVAEASYQAGADRVIVNNGGDIALKASPGQKPFRVGLVDDLALGKTNHILTIDPQEKIGGVATSGLGGRSLTKGVASAVTCWGHACPLTDAAATCVANATFLKNPAVQTCKAEELDPMTDLHGQLVVKSVGKLNDQARDQALSQGLKRASELIEKGMIKGCVIFVNGRMASISADSAIYQYKENDQKTGQFFQELKEKPALNEDSYGA